MNAIEVCLSPALLEYRSLRTGFITVVTDVLRATTAFCAAFDSGLESLLPVEGLEELKILGSQGYLTAAERDGKKVDFADFGNSPVRFLQADLTGKKLAYSTTNGTRAIGLAKEAGPFTVAAFSNLDAVTAYLAAQQKDILILCSGWKSSFSLEDSVCAGAIASGLTSSGRYSLAGDPALAAVKLWDESRDHLQEFCSPGDHYRRLQKLGLQDDLDYSFRLNTSKAVPVWNTMHLARHSPIW